MELLGDSILNYVVTESLYHDFKNLSEGDLTKKRSKIVNHKTLYKISRKINLDRYILFGKSLQLLNEKILADCYESLIAAILLDSNLDNVKNFINQTLLSEISTYETEMNYKGKLIEYCEKNKLTKPIFITKRDRDVFLTEVNLKSHKKKYHAKGRNKKISERNASKKSLSFLEKINS